MLIIAAGTTIIFGMVQLGLFGQKKMIVQNAAEYAKVTQARNAAFTGIQLAMEEINQDDSWNPTEISPWLTDVEGADVTLYYEYLGTGTTALDSDTLRMVSVANYFGEIASIESIFIKTALDFVPEFESALSFATNQFTFSASGNALVSGNDFSGKCADKPAIVVKDQQSYDEVLQPDGLLGALGGDDNSEHFESNVSKISINPDISYSPVDELIARLLNLPGTQSISGSYKGTLGSASDPGVFFVENYAKLTGGITAGYGIMVIRSGGELEYEGALSVAGNFEFNGLIIFENAFDLKGSGTPDIKGSVLVGTTDDSNTTLDVNLNGELKLQYDCSAEAYAKNASAKLLKQNRFIRLSIFE